VTDFHGYDRPVHAPADGRVVLVHDGVPDAKPGKPEQFRRGGNLIAMEVAPDQYLFLMHLKAGSIRVRSGDRVTRGELLAHVGNSGNSTEPHVHMHLQDTMSIDQGQGIPFYFEKYLDLRTGARVERGMPEGGIERGRHVGHIVRRAEQ
jgi:murein DD-endopeptidase MepM/ murein hydrolase activator NlpD